jgi:hypothetical protein
MNASKFNKIALFSLATAFAVFSSCHKTEELLPEDITTFQLMTTDLDDPNLPVKNYFWNDLDLDGPKPSTVDSITFKEGHTYAVEIKLFNVEAGTSINITEEIRELKDEHIFVFVPTYAQLQVKITDVDSEKRDVGLTSTILAKSKSKGTLKVLLKHLADKNDALRTGSEDLNIDFPVRVE